MTCFIVIAFPYMLNCNNYATLPLNLQLTVIESNERLLQIIMMGDANVCSLKWKEKDFSHRIVADEILSSLAQCGLVNQDLGYTYLADRLSPSGDTIQSALDHVYIYISISMYHFLLMTHILLEVSYSFLCSTMLPCKVTIKIYFCKKLTGTCRTCSINLYSKRAG